MKVFLSSTYDDLTVHREHVRDIIIRNEKIYKGMEYFGASPEVPLERCRYEVDRCDVFICVIGTRYGSRPLGSRLSYTEHEVDRAVEKGKRIHAYFIDEEKQRVLPKHVDVGADHIALMKLKKKIVGECSPCFFTTPSDLASQVLSDLVSGTPSFDEAIAEVIDPTATEYRETAYDSVAQWYDFWYKDHWCDTEPSSTILGIISALSPGSASEKLTILDVACGTGNTYVSLKRENHLVFGCDGSREMLKRAIANCKTADVSFEGIINERVTWTDLDGYLRHFSEGSFDVILNTANSFCHIPPVPSHMDRALENFWKLLKPGGLLVIDTKRYIKEGESEGVPVYKELRYVKPDWIVRTFREEAGVVPKVGKVQFHTKLHYDVDPSFSSNVPRALIVLTVYGNNLSPRTALIPYYPLPAIELEKRMQAAGFLTTFYPAMAELAQNWKYDIVVGRKEY